MKNHLIASLTLLLYIFGCTSPKNSEEKVNQKIERRDSLTYFTYGPAVEAYYGQAQEKITKKYGIHFYTFGCEVDDSIRQLITDNNKILFTKIQQRYPGFNEDEMLWEMQMLVNTQKKIEGTVFSSKFGKQIMKEIEKERKLVHIDWELPDSLQEIYFVNFFTFDDYTQKDSSSYRLKVNPNTLEIWREDAQGNWQHLSN